MCKPKLCPSRHFAIEESKSLESDTDEILEGSKYSGTPKKIKSLFSGSHCVDCYVEQVTLSLNKRVHFKEAELLGEC